MSAGTTATEVPQVRRASLRGWWLLLLVQLLLVLALGLPDSAASWLLQGIHLLTACLCAFHLSRDNRPFSLNQVYWVFTFVFLALMPSLFYSLDFLPHGRAPLSLLLKGSGLALTCSLLYTLLHALLSRRFPEKSSARSTVLPPLPAGFAMRGPAILLLCVLALVILLGPANIWLPIPFWKALSEKVPNTFLQLLIQYGLRGAMLAVCLTAAFGFRQRQLSARYFALILALALIGNFPLSLSRYLAGAFYLGVLLWAMPPRYLKAPRFALTLLALILLAAPLLNAPRMQNFPVAPGEQRDFAFLLRTSYGADYDAYALLCRTVQYTDSFGSTGGKQAAGALLFFVPRYLWPDKPVGSGSMVFDKTVPRADQWNNVSCPLIGEGYVNFGIMGSLLFTSLLTAGLFFYDRKFWQWQQGGRPLGYVILFYPVAAGLLLLWLRGDMMSAVAYTVGLFVSGAAVYYLFFRVRRKPGSAT